MANKSKLTLEEKEQAKRFADRTGFSVAVAEAIALKGKLAEDFKRIFNGKRPSKELK